MTYNYKTKAEQELRGIIAPSKMIFHNQKEGILGLPKGSFKVIKEVNEKKITPLTFSELLVRDIKTGKEYIIPTGNAQVIFGLDLD